MRLLSARCDSVIEETHLEALPSALNLAATMSKFTGKPKKGAAGKKTRAEEMADERPQEGSVTCLQFSDGCQLLDQPELFVGFESGAIGMFRVFMEASRADGTPGPMKVKKIFTAQKLI